MKEMLLEILEITLGMSVLILLLGVVLRLIGKKLTAKSRYVIWTLVILRLAVPVGFDLIPAVIEFAVVPETVHLEWAGEHLNENNAHMENINAETGHQVMHPTDDEEPVEDVQVNNNVVTDNGNLVTPDSNAVIGGIITSNNGIVTDGGRVEETNTAPDHNDVKDHSAVPNANPVTEDEPTGNGIKIDLLFAGSILYIAGAAVFFIFNLVSYRAYTRRIIKSSVPAEEETQQVFEALCREMKIGRVPVLSVSCDTSSPVAFGIFRRRIILPEIPLSWNSLRLTLAHELTHIRRGDLYVKLLSLAARSIHWFNPIVHYAAFRCDAEAEMSCDEAVLTGNDEVRCEYGETMLDIIRFCRPGKGTLTTHFNPRKATVKSRLANILYGSGKSRGVVLIALCTVLCIFAGTVVGCGIAKGEDETESTTSESAEETVETEAETEVETETATEDATAGEVVDEPEEADPVKLTPVVSKDAVPSQSYLGTWVSEDDAMHNVEIKSITQDEIKFRDSIFRLFVCEATAVLQDGEWVFGDGISPDTQGFSGKLEFTDNSIVLTYDAFGVFEKYSYWKGPIKLTQNMYDGKIYPCGTETTYSPIIGEYDITISNQNSPYHITNRSVYECNDGCTDPEYCMTEQLVADHSTADLYEPELIAEYIPSDGWNYPTKVYTTKFVGDDPDAYDEIEININTRSYEYVVKLSDKIHLILSIAPYDNQSAAPEGELETVNEIVKTLSASYTLNVKTDMKAENGPQITGKILGGDDAYITNGRDIMRESTVTFGTWYDGYVPMYGRVVLCEGKCTCNEDDLFSQFRGLPDLVKCSEHGADDGYPFPTVRYERRSNEYTPGEHLTQDEIDKFNEQSKRNYYYTLDLGSGIHLALYIKPEDTSTSAPEDEAEMIEAMVKSVSVAFNLTGEKYTETGLVTENIIKNKYTWSDDGETYLTDDIGDATVLYRKNGAYEIGTCSLVKVEGEFDPVEAMLVSTQGYARGVGFEVTERYEHIFEWRNCSAVTCLRSTVPLPMLEEYQSKGDYDAIDRMSRHYGYIFENSSRDEYLIMSINPKAPAATPSENEQAIVDAIAQSTLVTFWGDTFTEDAEWIAQNTVIPEKIPEFDAGDMTLYTAEEALNIHPYWFDALPEYRDIYYWTPTFLVDLVDDEALAAWYSEMQDPDRATGALPQEPYTLSFIKRFKISKEVFEKACEDNIADMQMKHEEFGLDISDEGYEIHNADILYTFDEEIINDYYRR